MDSRQTIAATAVTAADQLDPDRGLRARWAPIEARCFDAAAAYVSANEQGGDDGSAFPPGAKNLYEQTTAHLADAARAVDEFYEANRAALEFAAAQASAVPRRADEAINEAGRVVRDLNGAHARYAHYPSVRAAVTALDGALGALGDARSAHRLAALRDATALVTRRVRELDEALAAAPSRALDAQRAVASVTTRLDAARTRAERLPPAFSALLREFNAASSRDLVDTEATSRRHIAEAATDLDAMRGALAAGDPEGALDLAAQARAHLADAEGAVDAVTERLTVLRSVREDPSSKTAQVRFRLRDAQHLAVTRGLTAEWGSVLDAQIERIERIESSLTGHHPDYWTFVVELDQVTAFIAKVVQRMRGQAESR